MELLPIHRKNGNSYRVVSRSRSAQSLYQLKSSTVIQPVKSSWAVIDECVGNRRLAHRCIASHRIQTHDLVRLRTVEFSNGPKKPS